MVTIHQVRKVLGDEVADALFKHFPGQQLNIPKKSSSMMFETIEERNTCIFNLCTKSGKSYDEVADMMDLTKDRIQKIVYNEHYKRIKSKQK